MKIVVIDGQGGKMGKAIVEQLKLRFPSQEIYGIGTNSLATSAMLKAGADYAATGENPVKVNSDNADIIVGPIGIIVPNALVGEISPAMAAAIGSSNAKKILIPVTRCQLWIAGVQEYSLSEYIRLAIQEIENQLHTLY